MHGMSSLHARASPPVRTHFGAAPPMTMPMGAHVGNGGVTPLQGVLRPRQLVRPSRRSPVHDPALVDALLEQAALADSRQHHGGQQGEQRQFCGAAFTTSAVRELPDGNVPDASLADSAAAQGWPKRASAISVSPEVVSGILVGGVYGVHPKPRPSSALLPAAIYALPSPPHAQRGARGGMALPRASGGLRMMRDSQSAMLLSTGGRRRSEHAHGLAHPRTSPPRAGRHGARTSPPRAASPARPAARLLAKLDAALSRQRHADAHAPPSERRGNELALHSEIWAELIKREAASQPELASLLSRIRSAYEGVLRANQPVAGSTAEPAEAPEAAEAAERSREEPGLSRVQAERSRAGLGWSRAGAQRINAEAEQSKAETERRIAQHAVAGGWQPQPNNAGVEEQPPAEAELSPAEAERASEAVRAAQLEAAAYREEVLQLRLLVGEQAGQLQRAVAEADELRAQCFALAAYQQPAGGAESAHNEHDAPRNPLERADAPPLLPVDPHSGRYTPSLGAGMRNSMRRPSSPSLLSTVAALQPARRRRHDAHSRVPAPRASAAPAPLRRPAHVSVRRAACAPCDSAPARLQQRRPRPFGRRGGARAP